jgi:hypothetical protein
MISRTHVPVRVFRQKFTLEDAIGSHACSLEASRRVTNDIPLGCPLFLPVHTVNCVQTLKVFQSVYVQRLTFGEGDRERQSLPVNRLLNLILCSRQLCQPATNN